MKTHTAKVNGVWYAFGDVSCDKITGIGCDKKHRRVGKKSENGILFVATMSANWLAAYKKAIRNGEYAGVLHF